MEIDPGKVVGAGGGIGGLIAFWYWLRSLRRDDHKANTVDTGWEGIVAALREEIARLHSEIERLNLRMRDLTLKVDRCELDRDAAHRLIAGFERRYGSRKKEGQEGAAFSKAARGDPA